MVHQVTNIELSTDQAKENFVKFDTEIHRRLKSENYGHKRSKRSPQDWANMLEEDPKFDDELKRLFNNADIPEADDLFQSCLKKHMWIWIYHYQEMKKVQIF